MVRAENLSTRIVTAENPEKVLRLLAGGGGDAALIGYHQARYLIQTRDISGITHTGPIIEPRQYCFAVREGNGGLLQELNEGLSGVMRDGTYDALYQRWLHDPFVPDEHAFLIGILPWILGGLGGLAVAGLNWSWSLRQAVRRRTTALRQEVRARQAAEEQIRMHQENMQALLSATDDYELLLDRTGAILAANKPFAQFAGYRPGDLIGENLVSFLPPDITGEVREWLDRALGSDREERIEISSGGRIFDVHLVPVPHTGTSKGVAVFARDITEERELEHQQEVALSRIEENLHQLAAANDEIRNPVAAIIGLADVGGGENAEEIIEQARRIDRIISRLDRGWLESLKIREFLFRYHHIGKEEDADE
ncbi:MAG: PAS domain S-box protein [Methanomicrobiales archaeon]